LAWPNPCTGPGDERFLGVPAVAPRPKQPSRRWFALVRFSTLAVTIMGLGGRLAYAASADEPAAVVAIGNLPTDHAVDAAAAEIPAHWRLETLVPEAAPPPEPPTEPDKLARAYLEADFLRCLSEIEHASLRLDQLLEQGRRPEAARTGTFAAACALGAGDEARARELLRRLLARELMEPAALRRTTPEFQRIAEEERLAGQRRGRVAVEIHTQPEGAQVRVDGIVRCTAAPCLLHLAHGEHALVAEKLGQRPRMMTAAIERDETLTVELEAASADETRRQLDAALGAGTDPSSMEISRCAASALGVGLLVLAWRQKGQVHAMVYRRSGGATTHVALADGPNGAARAVSAALREWRTEAPPTRSMFREPLFWATAVGVAVLSAGAVALIRHPENMRR
jgi:hypothetical protein